MNSKRICVAVLAVTVAWAPALLVAQVDPMANPGPSQYPQSPQGMNQPTNQPGSSTPPTGAQTTPNGSMRDSLGAPGQTGQQMLDKQFVRTAAENGLADVKLGSLAVEKGGPGVKELAQKMLDDHAAMNKDMDAVADSLGVMLPKKMNKDAQKEYEKLSALSGKDFDTEYLTFVAKAHYEDLHEFHMEASVAADPELAAEVVKGMGMMHQHLGLIANVAKDEGITLPPRPPRPAATTASK
jgi:putative membrane protein